MLVITKALKNMVTVSYFEFISDNFNAGKNPLGLRK
jgi:hypothetical protein